MHSNGGVFSGKRNRASSKTGTLNTSLNTNRQLKLLSPITRNLVTRSLHFKMKRDPGNEVTALFFHVFVGENDCPDYSVQNDGHTEDVKCS